jgi:ubiquinone/menaquinone biosynthesis C-methylase UbiE
VKRVILQKYFGFPHLLRRIQYPKIIQYLQWIRPENILDIGCGSGDLLVEMSKYAKVTGVDVNIRNNLNVIQKVPDGRPISYFEGNALNTPLKNESFDCLTLSSVLQMVKEDDKLLEECFRVLKPGGAVLLTVPIGYVFIPYLYKIKGFSKSFQKFFRLPSSYNIFLDNLNNKHGALGKGFYSIKELEQLLTQAGFTIRVWEYCPKKIGTFLYEFCLLFKWKQNKSLSIAGIKPMLLYPIGFFDRFLPKNSQGCEVLVYATRSTSESN